MAEASAVQEQTADVGERSICRCSLCCKGLLMPSANAPGDPIRPPIPPRSPLRPAPVPVLNEERENLLADLEQVLASIATTISEKPACLQVFQHSRHSKYVLDPKKRQKLLHSAARTKSKRKLRQAVESMQKALEEMKKMALLESSPSENLEAPLSEQLASEAAASQEQSLSEKVPLPEHPLSEKAALLERCLSDNAALQDQAPSSLSSYGESRTNTRRIRKRPCLTDEQRDNLYLLQEIQLRRMFP